MERMSSSSSTINTGRTLITAAQCSVCAPDGNLSKDMFRAIQSAQMQQPNPWREGLEQERVPEASCLVIFGASGDLTQRKLIPALYSLAHEGLLPSAQTIIGYARPDFTDDAFRMAMREACEKHARVRPVDDSVWETFARGLFYVRGDFSGPEGFNRLN